ncbi:hypothetical protein [Allorhodopirellula solitaria]|uniref:hypothetical protein n=1 Tax=Allorhodopirellula solitaria TaxID=2527987 RepID=UPI0016442291|nr:hypothetical protein [Allorhodopirellula solitaria]
MSPLLAVCALLSLAVAVASLLVMRLQKRLRGMHTLCLQLLRREHYYRDDDED